MNPLQQFNQLTLASLPQDPFLPIDGPFGPAFLDTEACICALRAAPIDNTIGWQCLGNKTQLVYTTTGGKWFHPKGSGIVNINSSVSDAQFPPDTSKPQIFDPSQGFVAINNNSKTDLDIYSKACTGRNQTTFTTAYYRAVAEIAENKLPVDAAPCYRPGAVPLEIQPADSWIKDGCNLGFLCKARYPVVSHMLRRRQDSSRLLQR